MAKSTIFGQNPHIGTGTHGQRQSGIGIDQSGTGTDASNSLDFCTIALLSPNSYTDSIGTLINC